MGLLDAPFCATQVILWLEEVIYEKLCDKKNAFRWESGAQLPGSERYDPRRPWVAR